MNSLSYLQNQFQAFLLNGDNDIQRSIISTKKLPAAARLNIYREAYQARLIDALSSNFPALKRYLGKKAFHDLSLEYLNAYPSNHYSIRWFGHKLAHFLSTHCSDNALFIAELAQFEWHIALAFDAADEAVFSVNQMAAVAPESWENLRLHFHPSVQLMTFSSNAVAIWQNLVNKQSFPELVIHSKAINWLSWRQDYVNRFYALSDAEALAIKIMKQGDTFSKLCTSLCSFYQPEQVAMQAAMLLKSWLQSELIVSISIS